VKFKRFQYPGYGDIRYENKVLVGKPPEKGITWKTKKMNFVYDDIRETDSGD
jgi:hypothetical protein